MFFLGLALLVAVAVQAAPMEEEMTVESGTVTVLTRPSTIFSKISLLPDWSFKKQFLRLQLISNVTKSVENCYILPTPLVTEIRHKMRLVCVLFTFENNTGRTDGRTDKTSYRDATAHLKTYEEAGKGSPV